MNSVGRGEQPKFEYIYVNPPRHKETLYHLICLKDKGRVNTELFPREVLVGGRRGWWWWWWEEDGGGGGGGRKTVMVVCVCVCVWWWW